MFKQIKGQDRAIKLLTNSIQHNRVSQAYLFHGPEGVGKFTTALYFAMALNCLAAEDKRPCGVCASCHKFLEFNHGDLTYIFPTPPFKATKDGELESSSIAEYQSHVENRKKTPWLKTYLSGNLVIRRESIIMLQTKLERSVKESNYRICIIEDADEMNIQTANSFLKTLEEPPENTVLILTTSKIQSLLPTIVSRCQLVYFKPLSFKIIEDILTTKYDIDKPTARSYSRIADGNLEQAIRLASDTKQESRHLMASLIQAALKADDMFIISSVGSSKDKYKPELVHDLLFHLAVWFNDIAMLQIGRQDINNVDYLELLETCAANNHDWDSAIPGSLCFLDDLHHKIDGNVNMQLIIINLFNHLKKSFTQTV
jgi:DNA polymerase-3 subunit delta'